MSKSSPSRRKNSEKSIKGNKGNPKNSGGSNGGPGLPKDDGSCSVKETDKTNNYKTKSVEDPSRYKTKKKKQRNLHFTREVDINGERFQLERSQIEKKTPWHGTDFGLEPLVDQDGNIVRHSKTKKPLAKQNAKNYNQFADNIEGFMKDPKTEKVEAYHRRDRKDGKKVIGFINRDQKKFVIFDKDTKKYITGWIMNQDQFEEFLENNNFI